MTRPLGVPAGVVVGRKRERTALADLLTRAEAGEPTITTIVGEPGIGKTTLADEVARRARQRGVRVARGAVDEVDRSTLSMWRGPMSTLGIEALDAELVGEDRRWEALGVITEALDAAAPIVVILDDLHWADERALWIVDHLGELLARGVAVVATTRSIDPRRRRASTGRVIALDGLSVDEVAELIDLSGAGSTSTSAPSTTFDAAALHGRTGGNPLFVCELLGAPADVGVPGAIDVALGHSLDRLTPAAQRSLGFLALGGTQTPTAVIAAALSLAPEVLLDHFHEAVDLGILIAPTVATVRFRHALFAETLIDRLPPADRRAIHAALATVWRDSGTSEAAEQSAVHAVRAVPAVDAVSAATAALITGRATWSADPSSAQRLLADAAEVLEQHAPAATRLRAEILLELGEARVAAVDWPGAAEVFERAASLTRRLGDPELHARAEALAAKKMSMFEDNAERRRRLSEAAAALPPGDHPLRVALLGRLAVAELGRGELWDSSRRHAQDAIEMAKRLDDPDLVATALIDRHLVAMHDTDLVARAAAADELIELGEAARRPDRVLIGLQWRYGAAISRGDLGGAKAVLDDSDVLAALMPSPEWTYSVMLRRAMICAIEGDRHTALRLTEASRLLGDRVLWPDESLGLEVGLRTLICRITGVADPALPALNEEFETSAKLPANNFFLVHSAAAAQAVGDVDTARRLVERIAASICRVGAPPEQPSTILLTGELVARLGLRRYAPALKAMCEPFRGYLTTESGFAVDQPTDTTVAQLALAAGDALEALQLIERSLDFVRAMPSPSYEARCLWHRSRIHRQLGDQRQADRDVRQARMIAERIGAELPGDHAALPAAAAGRAALSRQGSTWLVHSPHGDGVVAHSTGIDQLARLLAAAPAEVLAVDLSGSGVDGAPITASLGPALDTTAKHAYRRRIADLQEEIDEAERFHDPERAARAQIELDLLMRELRQAVGLHGRDRPVGSSAERARINVARSVRRAISAVRGAVPGLGAHLEASIRTGRACCYAPDPGARLDWEIQRN